MALSLSGLCLRAGLATAVLASLAVTADAAPRKRAADPEVWVTIATDELARLRSASRGRALDRLPVAFEGYQGVSVALTRESQIEYLAQRMHDRFHRCGSFVAHDSHEEALRWLYAPIAAAPQPEAYTIDNAATVNAIVAQTSTAKIISTIQQLSSYWTRYYTTQTGYDAAAWLKSDWEQIAASRPDVKVTFFDHPTWLQHSVIATIPGTDFPKEVVVLGAHLDSIRSGQATTGQAPGADDDASGIASLTETFRAAIAAGYRPARTVKFMGYAGEEAGLRGSKEIATAMNPNTGLTKMKVIGAFQLDMTNFKSSAPDAVDVGILIDAAHTNAAQNAFVGQLLSTYQPALLVNAATQCGYGCSDHSAWNVQGGVPASIAFEGKFGQHSQLLHTANDTLANADPTCNHALKFSKLAAAYMAEMAKGTIVP